MTTDIKFLEKQQSDFTELREQFEKQKLDDDDKSFVQETSKIEIEEKIVVEEATVDVTTTAVIVKNDEVDIKEISFDSDDMEDIDELDDLEDTDFLDDEEDYCDLNDILPQEMVMTVPSIKTQIENDVIETHIEKDVIRNDFKIDLYIANAKDYEDYDSEDSTDFMENEDDYVERDLVLANLEPKQVISKDISLNEELKLDEATDISQILNRYRNVLDTKEVIKEETEIEGSIKQVSTVAEEIDYVDRQDEDAENFKNPATIKSFPCESCDKIYKSSKSLKHHNLLHTGEKPHKCEECGESFRLKPQLSKHCKVEHND